MKFDIAEWPSKVYISRVFGEGKDSWVKMVELWHSNDQNVKEELKDCKYMLQVNNLFINRNISISYYIYLYMYTYIFYFIISNLFV